MEFICKKSNLQKSLAIAENIISSKNNLSLLSNVLLEVENNKLTISASDLKVSFKTSFDVDMKSSGKITVFNNKLYNIVKEIPEEDIHIILNDEKILNIKPFQSVTIDFNLKGISPDKFPTIQSISDDKYFIISQKILSEMIKKTLFSVSNDETRYYLNGVFMEKSENLLKFVSTDGKRLSYIKKFSEIPELESLSIIIPPKILSEAIKVLTEEGEAEIAFSKNHIFMRINHYYFVSNLIDGEFPDYEAAIPSEYENQFVFNNKEVQSAIRRISLLTDMETHKMIFDLFENTLRIYSTETNIGKAFEIVDIEYSGAEVSIAFNYTYMLDVLREIQNESITISFNNETSAIMLFAADDKDYIHIIMPMQR